MAAPPAYGKPPLSSDCAVSPHTKFLTSGWKGFETPPENTDKTALSETGGTESGTLDAQGGAVAPDLAAILDALTHLPEEARKQILGIIRDANTAAQSLVDPQGGSAGLSDGRDQHGDIGDRGVRL
jgi:hypothetical protein